ncbi:uncharacterized protein LOC123512255 isoform X1 [Portunus trituberculatus]|uniref:uncharacterized protein LOC123512255 isoform X1 n=1 Tax=Portunus trituberculatus TaxID=210409 RepID=UPI001E1CCF6A|nr:uncharacterized protein LOC123512255 isoform X1 [Portunus trituberculatus]XP_045124468.1 uncharacterized protein LOC123512255 isoform X1 [Portunus trituberculatus]XP_045124469.1 uncharacterized protein LOC123512255 isoform X1 [Portunus trituberculatus]XP_045124470.1 uncharacterized protein LOC123512255 isoform X1 [Portunus trituberculatus]
MILRSCTRSAICLLLMVTTVQGVWGLFCYSHIPDKEGSSGWVFCPSTSCYTVGMSILGMGNSKRGCADKTYEEGCMKAKAIIASGEVCFCNSFLCNYSSAGTKSLYLPLLILPYVIHKFL